MVRKLYKIDRGFFDDRRAWRKPPVEDGSSWPFAPLKYARGQCRLLRFAIYKSLNSF